MRGTATAVAGFVLSSWLACIDMKAAAAVNDILADDPPGRCALLDRSRYKVLRPEEDMAGLLGLAAILWLNREDGRHEARKATELLLEGVRELKRRSRPEGAIDAPPKAVGCRSLGDRDDLLQAAGAPQEGVADGSARFAFSSFEAAPARPIVSSLRLTASLNASPAPALSAKP